MKMYKSDILEYLIELDESLSEGGACLHVSVAGGSALAFYWDNRGTRDIDVAYPTDLPDDILDAAFYIADKHGLPLDWINTDMTVLDRPPENKFNKNVYKGKRFNIYVPDKKTLLAMKIYAGRNTDLADTIRLAKDIGITKREEMEEILHLCYTSEEVETVDKEFIDLIISMWDKTEDELAAMFNT